MLKTVTKKVKSLNASHVLAVVFLLFIIFVGLAAFPQFMTNTAAFFQNGGSIQEYIDTIDDQYYGMLEAKAGQPVLQDKGTYINLNGLMANVLGQPIMNERLKLTNGHLSFINETPPKQEAIEAAADNIARLCQKQLENGKHFLFVLCPSQISKYEDLLPAGHTDPTNDTADTLLQLLDERDVPYLDLRESMRVDGLNHSDSFYVTDHHWLPQTGFWAYTKILDKLEQLGAISPVDTFYTQAENYEFRTYEDTFLGSSGKRTGIYYAGVDDSCFIAPKFDTDISVNIDSINISKQGRYEDVSYATWDTLTPDEVDYFNYNSYGLYGWGDRALTQWRNENAPQEGKFMLIGESFGNIPYSLMSIYMESCDELDMRHYTDDFASYFESYDPDTVILEVNVDQAVSDNTTYAYFPE